MYAYLYIYITGISEIAKAESKIGRQRYGFFAGIAAYAPIFQQKTRFRLAKEAETQVKLTPNTNIFSTFAARGLHIIMAGSSRISR